MIPPRLFPKYIRALATMRRALVGRAHPAIMSSFGKDSMVVIHLAARLGVRTVLYLEDRDEIIDDAHREAVIAQYGLRMVRLRSGRAVLYSIQGQPYLLAFPFVSRTYALPVPTNINPWPGAGPYMCMDDRLRAEHGATLDHPVDCLITGMKRADWESNTCRVFVDALPPAEREAAAARFTATAAIADVRPDFRLVSPLLDWSHDDVWDFIEACRIPTSPRMYDGRARRPFTHYVCYRCHDPEGPFIVDCPKLGRRIANLGSSGTWGFGVQSLHNLGLITQEEARALG